MSFRSMAPACYLLSFLGFFALNNAMAEGYPDHPIKIILPYPAGGGTDVATRLVTQEMGKILGQSIIVMNRPGSGGKIGVALAKREKPDGYTLVLSSTSTMAVYPAIDPKLSYDPVNDFTHVGLIATTPGVLLANLELPADNIKDLGKLFNSDPSKYIIGSGTPTAFLAAEMYKKAINADVQTINYNGSPPLLVDLIPGRIHATFMIAGAAIPDIKSGRVKAIAVTGDKRMPQLPGIATLKEAGMGQVDASTWIGLAFPKGVPASDVKVISDAMNQALAKPQIAEQLAGLGFLIEGGSPERHAKTVESELAFWSKAYKDAGSPAMQ
ncbi:tripartite tricarboxylate transporter substrate binding protein [Achromobacter sp. UMC46]|uniref:Bug family tripartite tricarboxylate transporter substrate binding protein n=1 Tax=Achromobacter sp. UMC46 TaxID=1862319 RepID=UPI001601CC37|nr:tripartite tricarboxylate transporter substrate binding protein [Achromobacter sp. UMC46]MBB1597783.1 hypothetical protein [Achromobacter sp. UMC46]